MKKPILFNTEMVKAILDGRKTQTRRPIKLNIKKDNEAHSLNGAVFTIDNKLYFEHNLIENFSKYKTGDVLYVREKSYFVDCDCQCPWQCSPQYWYATDEVSYSGIRCSVETIPSIHMPKKYARIFLKVTNVRVERVQDITREDALKEGIKKGLLDMYKHYEISGNGFSDKDYNLNGKYVNGAICSFRTLWNSNAKDGCKWEDNPYVFVYEFERIERQ